MRQMLLRQNAVSLSCFTAEQSPVVHGSIRGIPTAVRFPTRLPRMHLQRKSLPSAPASSRSSKAAVQEPGAWVLSTLQAADAVAFDVDSTLCEDESIDELARFLGCGKKIAELTEKAMGGAVKFEDALRERLDIMQVSQDDMGNFLASHPPRMSPGIKELVEKLHAMGKSVYIVSGGFRQIIEPIAEVLKIPKSNIHANRILYDHAGRYAGFDDKEFTSRSGGKPAALRFIKESDACKSIVMIGDGVTDMEARLEGVADLFIGYGGVVKRESVAAGADWYIDSFDVLLEALTS